MFSFVIIDKFQLFVHIIGLLEEFFEYFQMQLTRKLVFKLLNKVIFNDLVEYF